MPRFFFDWSEDGVCSPDYAGAEFESFDAAQREALVTLPAIARDSLKRARGREFMVVIRDQTGPLFKAQLSLTTQRLNDSNHALEAGPA